MSEESEAPPFKPVEAMQNLKRRLHDLRLAERAGAFELRGQTVVELSVGDTAIETRLAKRPARTPEWTRHSLKSSADVRRFIESVKQQLARWNAADE